MSRFPPTPWEVVEGAPNGEAWVCAYAPITQGGYDEAPEQEDTRLFAAPPSIAAEVVRRVNAHEALVAALEDLLARCGGISPLAGVPSVKAVRDAGKLLASMDAARAALAKAGGK